MKKIAYYTLTDCEVLEQVRTLARQVEILHTYSIRNNKSFSLQEACNLICMRSTFDIPSFIVQSYLESSGDRSDLKERLKMLLNGLRKYLMSDDELEFFNKHNLDYEGNPIG